MPGNPRFSYQKLKKEPSLYGEDGEKQEEAQAVVQFRPQERPASSSRIRLRKRWRFRVPRLRKLFKRRKFVWASWAKILRRLKESQAHFGDLFAGNYLFLQVTPESLKYYLCN
ncbi:hypothetical protein V2J09_005850 [Rumex salicifolius]